MDWLFGQSTPYIEGPWNWDRAGYDKAKENFRAIHGEDVPPWFNAFSLYADYRKPTGVKAILLMDVPELAAKTADLTQRIDAAKAKYGVA